MALITWRCRCPVFSRLYLLYLKFLFYTAPIVQLAAGGAELMQHHCPPAMQYFSDLHCSNKIPQTVLI